MGMMQEIQTEMVALKKEIHQATIKQSESKTTKAILEEIFIPIRTGKKLTKAEMKKAQVDALRAERLIEMKRKTSK